MTDYRCEATSVAGFVQQLSVAYVTHGIVGSFDLHHFDVIYRSESADLRHDVIERQAVRVGGYRLLVRKLHDPRPIRQHRQPR